MQYMLARIDRRTSNDWGLSEAARLMMSGGQFLLAVNVGG
jgi:hypothetical protein